MEALNFMKFWRARTRRETKISDVLDDTETEVEFSEGDDSFFELELSLSDFSLTYKKTPEESTKPDRTEATTMKTTSSVSSTDYFSKNKVIPVEIGTKLDSPIAHLKSSGSKFRAFSFKKLKPVDSEKSTSGTSTPTLRNEKKERCKSFNVRFSTEYSNETKPFQDAAAPSVPSLSKKFFSLIKPLQAMTVKKQTMKEDGVSVMSSPVMEKQRSNVAVGIRIVRRHLGKSRSASAAVGGMSPANRYDESLQVQQDGIQSAILHCKRSFDGSREWSMLSRSTSDSSSREKLSTSSSEESYTFSRIASDHISDKSMEIQSMNVALKSLCFGSGDLDQGTVAEQSIVNKKSLN